MAVGTLGHPAAAQGAKMGEVGGAPPAPAGAPAVSAVPAFEQLPLLPKRKRGKGGVARVSTMAAFAVECDCRSSAKPAAAAACNYYEVHCDSPKAAGGQAPVALYSFLDAPAVLRFNKFVRSGYRAGYGYKQCCASVLSVHNETGNIWTHLLPLLLLVSLLAGGQLQAWQGARVAFFANVASIAACFLGSVLFHTFCANHHHYHRWLCLDVCGILLVLIGGGHMVLWWGLHCHPTVRIAFAWLYYGTGAVCVHAALTATSAKARGLPMLALLAVRLTSFAARSVLEPHSLALQHYAAMEVFSLLGGLANVLRVPERWLQPSDPSKAAPLDYLLNSHQIMHVLVAGAMWQLHLGATADYHHVSALLSGEAQCPA